jgi:hypothetical protein
VGLASIALSTQRTGGSAAHPGEALDARLEALSAGIEAGAGPQALTLGFQCLKEDAGEVGRPAAGGPSASCTPWALR